MKITPRGEAFIARMEIVNAMVRAGTPFFAAMAAGLEDDDWILAYAAVRTMAQELSMKIEVCAVVKPFEPDDLKVPFEDQNETAGAQRPNPNNRQQRGY